MLELSQRKRRRKRRRRRRIGGKTRKTRTRILTKMELPKRIARTFYLQRTLETTLHAEDARKRCTFPIPIRARFKTIEQLLEEQEELSPSSESKSPMVFTDHTGRETKLKTMDSEFTLSKVDRSAVGFEVFPLLSLSSLARLQPRIARLTGRKSHSGLQSKSRAARQTPRREDRIRR